MTYISITASEFEVILFILVKLKLMESLSWIFLTNNGSAIALSTWLLNENQFEVIGYLE